MHHGLLLHHMLRVRIIIVVSGLLILHHSIGPRLRLRLVLLLLLHVWHLHSNHAWLLHEWLMHGLTNRLARVRVICHGSLLPSLFILFSESNVLL